MDVRSLSRLEEILLVVDLRIFAQGAFVGEGQDLLQDIHLPQDLAQPVDPHGLLMLHDGFFEVSFACEGAEGAEPDGAAAPAPFPLGCPRISGAVPPPCCDSGTAQSRSQP